MDIAESYQFNAVKQSLQNDVFANLGISPNSILRLAVQPLLKKPVQRVCELAFSFDHSVRACGFARAARELVGAFYNGELVAWQFIDGQATPAVIPKEGPLLVVANHPGTLDVLSVAACLPRDDVRIIARGYHILRSLPNVRQHLIYAERDTPTRMAVAREALRHLQKGGVLIFCPNGRLDPDPAYLPGAFEAVWGWSQSVGLFLSKVPETKLMIAVLSGYLTPYALNHPLIRVKKSPYQRLIISEILQVLVMLNSQEKMKAPLISFSAPLSFIELHSPPEAISRGGDKVGEMPPKRVSQDELMQSVGEIATQQLRMHLDLRRNLA